MITSKRISVIAAVIFATMLVFTLSVMAFSDDFVTLMGGAGVSMSYEEKLFNTDQILAINIEMDQEDWNDLLQNSVSEEYAMCDVVVDGTTFSNVGIRAKGNSSLSQVASADSNRYSFKVEFDHYIADQNCFGLDKLALNNCFADATMMREYLAYDMFAYLGADASLYNYAVIYVNGKYWGVYLALEAVEESFMVRNYGTNYGEAYKPDSLNFGGAGRMQGVEMDDMFQRIQEAWGTGWQDPTENGTRTDIGANSTDLPAAAGQGNRPKNLPNASVADLSRLGGPAVGTPTDRRPATEREPRFNLPGPGGGSGITSAATLNYLGEDLDDYVAIWDASVFDSSDSDHKRVLNALKNISEGRALEKYMDVENLLKYMAVQTFVYNLDSLTGNMAHNYYLYEEDGLLNLIPWDYNMAFGGFQTRSAADMVNFPIDTPFTSALEDREFFAALLEEYQTQYHEYLRTLVEKYVLGGEFMLVYERVRSQIDDLVTEDPTAFFSYDEYDAAAQMLCTLIALRGESVLGQLDGTIPSTTTGQKADSSAVIDASAIDLSVLGSMGRGGTNGIGNRGGGNVFAASGTNLRLPGGGTRSSTTDFAVPGGVDGRNAEALPGGESFMLNQGSIPGTAAQGRMPSYNMTTVYWVLGCVGAMLLALSAIKFFRRK